MLLFSFQLKVSYQTEIPGPSFGLGRPPVSSYSECRLQSKEGAIHTTSKYKIKCHYS